MAEKKKTKLTGKALEKKRKTALRNRARGKANATRQAQMINALNVGALGGEDGADTTFSWEFKNREKSALHGFMDQAVANCPPKRVPAVIVHKHKDKRENDIICIRFKDWHKVCRNFCYKPPKRKRVKVAGKSYHV